MADEVCTLAARRLLEADNLRLRTALTDAKGEITGVRYTLTELQEALVNSRKALAAAHAAAETARQELTAQQILLENVRKEMAAQQTLLDNIQRQVAALPASTFRRISTQIRAVGRLFGRERPEGRHGRGRG